MSKEETKIQEKVLRDQNGRPIGVITRSRSKQKPLPVGIMNMELNQFRKVKGVA